MTQTARPASDITTTNWTTAPLFSKINDASDATSVRCNNGVTTNMEVKLGPLTDPGVSTGHIVYVRCFSTGSSAAEKGDALLYQGSTLIATGAAGTNLVRTTPTTISYTLTAGEANAITDYTDLRVRVRMSTGGATEFMTITDIWMEVPDAITEFNLIVAEARSLHAADAAAITKQSDLVVADAGHGHAVDNIALSPIPTSGLVGRYDFGSSDSLFQDTARTSAVTADAQTIQGVTDLSGAGNHLSEGTDPPAYKTGIVNGLSVARFTNTTVLKASGMADAALRTLFVVGYVTDDTVNQYFLDFGGGNTQVLTNPSGGSNAVRAYASVILDHFVSAGTLESPHVLTAVYRGDATSQVGLDDTYTTGNAGTTHAGGLVVGQYAGPPAPPNYGLTGDICEVVVYDRALSSVELTEVTEYLSEKWTPAGGPVTLSIADGRSTHAADAPAITKQSDLVVQDGTHAHTTDGISLAPIPTSGLSARYDFSALSSLFQDMARTSAVTADGQMIKGVTDLSGAGNHLSEATNGPAYKTAAINGRSTSRFVNTHVLNASTPDMAVTTIFLVGFVTDDTVNQVFCDHTGSGSQAISNPPGATRAIRAYSGTIFDYAVPATTMLTPHVIGVVFNGSSSKVVFDGAVATGDAGTAHAAGLILGQYGVPGYGLTGDIGEFIVWDRALSAGELTQVSDYLSDKWISTGVTLVVADGRSTHASDPITVQHARHYAWSDPDSATVSLTATNLVVADGAHAHTADALALTKQATVTVAAATTGTVALARAAKMTKLIAAGSAMVAAMTRRSTKTVAANVTSVVAQIHRMPKTVAAVSSIGAAISRQAGKPIAVVSTLTVAVSRRVGKVVSVLMSVGAALTRRLAKTIAVVFTSTIAIAMQKVFLRLIAATSPITAALSTSRRMSKLVAAGAVMTAAITRRTAKSVAAGASLIVAITRRSAETVAASVMLTVGLARQVARKLTIAASSAISAAVSTVLQTGPQQFLQAVDAVVTLGVAISRRTTKLVATMALLGAAINRRMTETVAAGVTLVAAVARLKVFVRLIAATTAIGVQISRRANKLLAIAVTGTVVMSRRVFKPVAVGVSVAVGLTRRLAKVVAVGLPVVASVTFTKVKLQIVAVTTTLVATLRRSQAKLIATTVSLGVGLSRRVGKLVPAGVSMTTALVRRSARTVAVAATFAVSISRMIGHLLEVPVTVAVTVGRGVVRVVTIAVSSTIVTVLKVVKGLGETFFQAIDAAVSFVVSVDRSIGQIIAVAVGLTVGLVRRLINRTWGGSANGKWPQDHHPEWPQDESEDEPSWPVRR